MLNAPIPSIPATIALGVSAEPVTSLSPAIRAAPGEPIVPAVPGARAPVAVPAAANGTAATGAPWAVPSTWNEWLVSWFTYVRSCAPAWLVSWPRSALAATATMTAPPAASRHSVTAASLTHSETRGPPRSASRHTLQSACPPQLAQARPRIHVCGQRSQVIPSARCRVALARPRPRRAGSPGHTPRCTRLGRRGPGPQPRCQSACRTGRPGQPTGTARRSRSCLRCRAVPPARAGTPGDRGCCHGPKRLTAWTGSLRARRHRVPDGLGTLGHRQPHGAARAEPMP